MKIWSKAVAAVVLMTLGSSALANQDLGFLRNKTKMEIFQEIQKTCTVKIGNQNLAFRDVRSESGDGWTSLVISTDAQDRQDHVYAELSMNFRIAREANGANLVRYADLSDVSLRALNRTVWFGAGDVAREDTTPTLLIEALKGRSLSLTSQAWADGTNKVTATLECNPSSWLEL